MNRQKWQEQNESQEQSQNEIEDKTQDEILPRAFRPGQGLGDTMWKYEQLRAGQVYNKFMFHTRREAEEFAMKMAWAEPDLVSRIEPVEARTVWN